MNAPIVATDFAGRLFRFTERSERTLADGMKDIDEITAAMENLYPGNTWSRADILLLFFLDDIADAIHRVEKIAEDRDR